MTYEEYINRFIKGYTTKNIPVPGEHHFVSVFLMTRIFNLTGFYPQYINPDGMKNLLGDLIYEENNVSIEVKYDSIIFTEKEFNDWILNDNETPKYFMCINERGILLLKWAEFKIHYCKCLEGVKGIPLNTVIGKKYTPKMSFEDYLGQWDFDNIGQDTEEYFQNGSGDDKLLDKKLLEMFQ
ncbi:MAG: hypothetical protein Ta2B_30960 [Termitinemataceae bacterium]|nr:MAG: hypothetical protein Ta2B_30960 [Termitinemataceae bacterium]